MLLLGLQSCLLSKQCMAFCRQFSIIESKSILFNTQKAPAMPTFSDIQSITELLRTKTGSFKISTFVVAQSLGFFPLHLYAFIKRGSSNLCLRRRLGTT